MDRSAWMAYSVWCLIDIVMELDLDLNFGFWTWIPWLFLFLCFLIFYLFFFVSDIGLVWCTFFLSSIVYIRSLNEWMNEWIHEYECMSTRVYSMNRRAFVISLRFWDFGLDRWRNDMGMGSGYTYVLFILFYLTYLSSLIWFDSFDYLNFFYLLNNKFTWVIEFIRVITFVHFTPLELGRWITLDISICILSSRKTSDRFNPIPSRPIPPVCISSHSPPFHGFMPGQ